MTLKGDDSMKDKTKYRKKLNTIRLFWQKYHLNHNTGEWTGIGWNLSCIIVYIGWAYSLL